MKVAIFLLLIFLAFNLSYLFGNLGFFFSNSSLSDTSTFLLFGDMADLTQENSQAIQNKTHKKYINSFKEKAEKTEDIFNIPIPTIEKYYDIIGPSAMLDVVEEDPLCHDKGHNIGRVIFYRTKSFEKSLNICGSRCDGGCFHGVVEELIKTFAKSKKKNIDDDSLLKYPEFKIFLNDLCQDDYRRYAKIGSCYHAIGHALMFLSGYNISKANNFCHLLKEEKGKGGVYYCSTGVYMEYQHAFGIDDLRSNRGAYPCNESVDFPAACYRYRLQFLYRSLDNVSQAKEHCLSLDEHKRLGCFHGLGFAFYGAVMKNPSLLPAICGAGNLNDQRMCIDSAIGPITPRSLRKAKEACTYLSGAAKAYCVEAVSNGNFGMNKPFDLYYYMNPSNPYFGEI